MGLSCFLSIVRITAGLYDSWVCVSTLIWSTVVGVDEDFCQVQQCKQRPRSPL